MKTTVLLAAIAVMGGLGFNHAHAQLGFEPGAFLDVEALQVKLTAHVQDDLEEIDNGVRQGIQKFKLNNKAILQMLGAPNNSRLVLLDGFQVGVQTGGGINGTGITGGLEDIVGDAFLVEGKATETASAAKQDITQRYVGVFSLSTMEPAAIDPDDLQDFELFVVGKASERQKIVEDSSGLDVRHAFAIEGAGDGQIITSTDNVSALLTGSVSTSGKELDILLR